MLLILISLINIMLLALFFVKLSNSCNFYIYINTKVIFHENLYFNLEDFNQKTPFKNLFIILLSLMLFFDD